MTSPHFSSNTKPAEQPGAKGAQAAGAPSTAESASAAENFPAVEVWEAEQKTLAPLAPPAPDTASAPVTTPWRRWYLAVKHKFALGHIIAILWLLLSIWLSLPWVRDLSMVVGLPFSIAIIAGIGYIPGYINAFNVMSLLLDRQPPLKVLDPVEPVTILIACRNEEKAIADTLRYIKRQDYKGPLHVKVIDNASTDDTAGAARRAAQELGMDVEVLSEANPGKFNALNHGLTKTTSQYVITLDADTLLMPASVRYLMSRILTAPADVAAVAGSVLVRNSRKNFMTRLQEWDYFLGIASIKRMQGLFQGTLVAQGAYSVYRADMVREVGGWPNAIGEDIVLTWSMLAKDHRVFYEPLAVAFTDVPETLQSFAKQRNRWARGMIEALKLFKPWRQPKPYFRYLTGINLVMPYLDIVYTFAWIPGVVLALTGNFLLAGPMTLLVIPLAAIQNWVLYRYQQGIFKTLNLKIRNNRIMFIFYMLFYQFIMSPISVWGYIQEVFRLKRTWK